MAFGIPAHATGSRKFALTPAELSAATANALSALGWPFLAPAPTHFEVSIKLSFWSWGEKAQIDIAADGTVHVRSQCVFPFEFFDCGKNRRNVNRLLDELTRQIGP